MRFIYPRKKKPEEEIMTVFQYKENVSKTGWRSVVLNSQWAKVRKK